MKQILRNKDSGTQLVRYKKSFLHSLDGFKYALFNEHNMIIIIPCAVLVVIAGFAFKISSVEWLFVILIIGLVIGTEMINTAIEAVVDLKTLEYHPLAKIAKDTASSATLVFCIISFLGALIIFVPKLMFLLR